MSPLTPAKQSKRVRIKVVSSEVDQRETCPAGPSIVSSQSPRGRPLGLTSNVAPASRARARPSAGGDTLKFPDETHVAARGGLVRLRENFHRSIRKAHVRRISPPHAPQLVAAAPARVSSLSSPACEAAPSRRSRAAQHVARAAARVVRQRSRGEGEPENLSCQRARVRGSVGRSVGAVRAVSNHPTRRAVALDSGEESRTASPPDADGRRAEVGPRLRGTPSPVSRDFPARGASRTGPNERLTGIESTRWSRSRRGGVKRARRGFARAEWLRILHASAAPLEFDRAPVVIETEGRRRGTQLLRLTEIQERLRERVRASASARFNVELEHVPAEVPPRTQLGDLAFPVAFELAKRIKQATGEKRPPRAIAEELRLIWKTPPRSPASKSPAPATSTSSTTARPSSRTHDCDARAGDR